MMPFQRVAKRRSFRTACLLLAAGAVLAPAAATANPATERLQGLVEEVDLQLHLTLRAQPARLEGLRGELQQALEAWNRSGRTDDDLAVMERWLREAMRTTMPGRPGTPALPPTPDFVVAPRVIEIDPQPQATGDSVFADPPPVAEAAEDLPAPGDFKPFDWSERAAPLAADKPAEQPTAQRPAPEQQLTLQKHPAASGLTWGDPFLDDPLPASEAAVRTTRMKPTSGVTINLAELSARARGYRKGIESIESALLSAPNASAFRLAGLTREVESLCEQRELVELYLTSAAGAGPTIRGQLVSPTSVVDLIHQRAVKRRKTLDKENPPSADAERAVLAGVQRKLEDLAGAAPR